ncbi:MAG: hypothetical protein RR729_01680 [Comamonas sp.]
MTNTSPDSMQVCMPQEADTLTPVKGSLADLRLSNAVPDAAQPNAGISQSILGLRLSSSYTEVLCGAPILTTVKVGKPPKAHFFRVSPDPAHQAVFVLLDGNKLDADGMYAISPEIAAEIPDHVRAYQLRLAVTTFDVPYLVPIPLPGADGRRNVWHVSLGQAVTLAESDWIRISANTTRGAYDVFRAHNQTQEPKWPDLSFDQLLELAFRDRLILNREHQLLARLRGE